MRFCPACDHMLAHEQQRFCDSCGTDLSGSAQPSNSEESQYEFGAVRDENLARLLRSQLGLAENARVTVRHMGALSGLVRIDASGADPAGQINSLEGMQYATNVEALHLFRVDHLADFTPLSGMGSLRELVLAGDSDFERQSRGAVLGEHNRDLNSLRHLSQLEGLAIFRFEDLTDTRFLNGLTNLKGLQLNSVGRIDFRDCSGLRSLETLSLENIDDLALDSMPVFPNLRDLYIDGVREIAGVAPSQPMLSNLQILNMAIDRLERSLPSFNKATTLTLRNVGGVRSLRPFCVFTHLREVSLDSVYNDEFGWGDADTKLDVEPLASLGHLHKVSIDAGSLHGIPLSVANLPRLAGLPKLEVLEVYDGDGGLRSCTDLAGFNTLRKLSVSLYFTSDFSEILRLKQLEELEIETSGTPECGDFLELPRLKVLSLTNSLLGWQGEMRTELEDAELLADHPSLQRLTLKDWRLGGTGYDDDETAADKLLEVFDVVTQSEARSSRRYDPDGYDHGIEYEILELVRK